jgi:hypothetical protein
MCGCVEVIRQTEHRSRIDRHCNASEFIGDIDFPRGMTFSELRSLSIYQKNKHKILKGEIYISQFNKYEGDVYTWNCKKDIFKILCKYNLLPCSC